MKIQFEKLFEIKIFHSYYKSGTSEDFDIEPTALCRNQLLNYGLLFKKTAGGFVVLYEVVEDDSGNPHPLKPIEENTKFSFTLQAKNSSLINYSNLPLNSKPNQIYHLHNLNDNQQNGSLFLTSDKTEDYMSQKDRIELISQLFQYSFESTNSSAQIEIVDDLDNLVFKKVVPIVEGMFNYSVDLRGYPPGKFTLKIDGAQKLEFYANDELIGKNIFGIIDIFRNDSVPQAYQFTETNGDVRKKTYTVKIEKRQTFWKYYMVLKYRPDITPDSLSIDSFVRKDTEILSDGNSMVPFVSSTPLSLQEKPIKGIQLKKATGNGSTSICKNLPNPSVRTIKPEASDKIYSEIFIYL